MSKLIELFEGDPRLGELAGEITEVILNRADDQNLPMPSVLGVLELIKIELFLKVRGRSPFGEG